MDDFVTVPEAAEALGYSVEGLKRRIRNLRVAGCVEDLGDPPEEYATAAQTEKAGTDPVRIYWINPRNFLIGADAPTSHFHTQGRQAQAEECG